MTPPIARASRSPAARWHDVARAHVLALPVIVLAATARFWRLGSLPSPAGDEANWTLTAWHLARGERVALSNDASFVTLAYARLIAASFRVAGPTFAAARSVGALASLLAVAGAYVLVARRDSVRSALASSLILAVHPWAVMWSRTASVPYSLALTTMVLGPLVWLEALRARRGVLVALAVQLIALGAQFSPLTIIAAVACGIDLLPRRNRWVLHDGWVLASVAAAAAEALPIARGALHVAQSISPPGGAAPLVARLGSFGHMVATGLAGEATVRHFTSAGLAPGLALIASAPCVLVAVIAFMRAATRLGEAERFGARYLLLGVILLPIVLSPSRAWDLATIDADRYLFALLPGFALWVGEMCSVRRPRWHRVLATISIAAIAATSARGAFDLVAGGGPDRGVLVLQGGGGYRGWKSTSEPVSTEVLVRDAVLRDTHGAQASIAIADWALRPLKFAVIGTNVRVVDVRGPTPVPREGRHFTLIWSDAVFSAPGSPREARVENDALRTMLFTTSPVARRVAIWQQPNGFPLLELWTAESMPVLR